MWHLMRLEFLVLLANHYTTREALEFLIMVDFFFFNISSRTGNLLSRQISKFKSTNQLNFLLKEYYIFGTKLEQITHQIKNSDSEKN